MGWAKSAKSGKLFPAVTICMTSMEFKKTEEITNTSMGRFKAVRAI